MSTRESEITIHPEYKIRALQNALGAAVVRAAATEAVVYQLQEELDSARSQLDAVTEENRRLQGQSS